MKKRLLFILTFIVIISSCSNAICSNISSEGYVVMECSSNRVLAGGNINEKLPMASTTKVMSAILAIENGNLKDVIKIEKRDTNIEGTSISLCEGEKLTLEDLLYGMMLVSGNDAAVTIANHLGGSIEGFAKMMNEKAKELGMNNTNFENPNGLPNDNHYTTAYDYGLLASYAMKNKTFVKIINTKKWSMPYKNRPNERIIYNRNKLLNSFDGANGVKTGYTKKAGKCLVFAAKRNGMQLVGVVLHSYNHYEDAKSLLSYGFANYSLEKVIRKGQYIQTKPYNESNKDKMKIYASKDIYFPVKKGEIVNTKFIKTYDSGNNHYITKYDIITNEKTYSSSFYPKVKIKKYNVINEFFVNIKNFFNLFN